MLFLYGMEMLEPVKKVICSFGVSLNMMISRNHTNRAGLNLFKYDPWPLIKSFWGVFGSTAMHANLKSLCRD